MDQSLVRSGFDAEIALGERYLQYLLLLAVDTGLIPVEFSFADTDPTKAPITARLVLPNDIDRTYTLDAGAVLPEPGGDDAGAVTILFGDPHGADLRIDAQLRLIRAPDLDVIGRIKLFVRLGLQKATSGGALDSAGLQIELVHVEGLTDVDRLKPFVDRTLSLDGLGTGGRVADIALRKFPADGDAPAALVLYLNLVLRSGPQSGAFLEPRGDVALGQNFLPPDQDLAFATRKDIYADMANDAFFRRAVPTGSGYSYPLKFKHRNGTLLGVVVEPIDEVNRADRLRMRIKAEVEVDNWPDPDITLIIDAFSGDDDEGVMTWNSASEAHDSSILHDALLAGIAAALIPLVGPGAALAIFTGLEIGKHVAEGLISDHYIGDRVERRLDATLLDIAPNRLTLLRRRWDPFYETQHQIGLRRGETMINADGVAFTGRAVLTRATKAIAGVVIRDSEHDGDAFPTALRYRVADIEPFRDQLAARAPAADRLAFLELQADVEPNLFQVGVDDAIVRIGSDRLLGTHPYLVEAIEVRANSISRLLVVSQRESDEQRDALIAEHRAAVEPGIVTANEPTERAAVLAEFATSGVIPTPEQIEAAVAARLQALVDADVEAYIDGPLAADLEARLLPLLRFELDADHFGRLQSDGVLELRDFDLVRIAARDAFYYRDHYVAAIETTAAKRRADNLRSKPRYRSTPTGPVFLH